MCCTVCTVGAEEKKIACNPCTPQYEAIKLLCDQIRVVSDKDRDELNVKMRGEISLTIIKLSIVDSEFLLQIQRCF